MVTTQLKKPTIHGNICMLTTAEMLHIMSISASTEVNFDSLLNNHGTAISMISDRQINHYVDNLSQRSKKQGGDALSGICLLPAKLKKMRDVHAAQSRRG